MLGALVSGFADFLVPPRRTEKLVRSLTIDALRDLYIGTPSRDIALLPYHDPRVTALIWEIKYYGNNRAAALAGEILGEELLAIAGEELGKPLLVPVPMHSARRRERGHNQTELLCETAMRNLNSSFEYAPHALMRVRATPRQQGLERTKRLKNIKGAMAVARPELVEGRVCVVVDDVMTTGAPRALHSACPLNNLRRFFYHIVHFAL